MNHLKSAVERCEPPQATAFLVPKARAARREVVRLLGDVTVDIPSDIDVKKVRKTLVDSWTVYGRYVGVPKGMYRLIPWAVWYPASTPDDWLGANLDFSQQFLNYLPHLLHLH